MPEDPEDRSGRAASRDPPSGTPAAGPKGALSGRVVAAGAAFFVLLVADINWEALTAVFPDAIGERAATAMLGVVRALTWAAAAMLLIGLLRNLVWEGAIVRRTGQRAPNLLQDITAAVIWIVAAVIVFAVVFDAPVAGLITTSGLLIAIIGFALRNLIADIFTGIAMGLDKPFRTGDWIEIETGDLGRVVDINWRATRIVTLDEITVVIPNSRLATYAFRNLSAPESFYRTSVEVVLDYHVQPEQAERVLLSAVRQIPELSTIPREPDVRAWGFTPRGKNWKLRFWVPNVTRAIQLRDKVERNILTSLNFAGLDVPAERIEFNRPAHVPDWQDAKQAEQAFLHDVDLFAALSEEELAYLAQNERRLSFPKGAAVVRQGEAGQSLYMVKEGLLTVSIREDGGAETQVGQLTPGSFFGEMSLLTGEPRAATVTASIDAVVYEIDKDQLEPLLRARPELVEMLSRHLAERQMRNEERMTHASAEEKEAHAESLAEQLLGRISQFFGLGHH